ncbi:AraC family transcriptional regulator [Microbacterium sp. MYb72]|uniref:GlxA family transcriptional regulator n=1 Tax=Microbacterium sp. MYb72 TaxID=1848693 RepID=UPI000CFC5B5B|nr:helix-turn-helix domain-containing protein [Microbacterium sp. MYb72]PRB11916.1 AraC family transcriptional regulator [Microbacterium sp. MYb72]
MRRRTVAVLAFPQISPFHLSVPTLVFGGAGLDGVEGLYDVAVCAEHPGSMPTGAGYAIQVDAGLETMSVADLVVIPSWREGMTPSPALLDAVTSAHARGARVVGLCLGTFVVSASGIADGREVSTHWAAAARLTSEQPQVEVRDDVLWTDLGDVITSAGAAAALDCCLHIVRSDHGATAATALARALVLAPHRTGSQAQYIPAPVVAASADDPIGRAMIWARARLTEVFDLDEWAEAVHLSRRTFTRRFRERTGTSPQQWLLDQRVDAARTLLESSDESVDRIAELAGFGSAVSLRLHFRQRLGVSPAAHRSTFRVGAA